MRKFFSELFNVIEDSVHPWEGGDFLLFVGFVVMLLVLV